jgi:hypothetical protein
LSHPRRAPGAIALIALGLLGARPAAAGGLYSEADLGATLFLGEAADSAAPGPALGARVGYHPAPWVGLGVVVAASTHEATAQPPPDGEHFQLYQVGLDLRFRLGVGRVGLFIEGSGGVAAVSTNVLDAPGITSPTRHVSPYLMGGGGVEYHTQSPRFAFGVAGDLSVYTDFGVMRTLGLRLYLRYTQ